MPKELEYHQKGFGLKAAVAGELQRDWHSGLVDRIRERGFRLEVGDATFKLVRDFGFCYGVDRAVDMAYETREKFPDRRIYLTNEIIHNPQVNRRLRELGILFFDDEVREAVVEEGDVVLLPAFGVTTDEFDRLRERGAVLVDTTCGSVLNVWRRVERYAREGRTSVVHGKWSHEETLATCSRALSYPEGRYLVVRDEAEAKLLCDFIEHGGDAAKFSETFREGEAASPGFDPDKDLERVGVANQTTMLSSESLHIAGMLKATLGRRFGAAQLDEHFLSFDTICSATQDRQDAVLALARSEDVDVFIVIGGFNSSNTSHLKELGDEFSRAYHIDGPECLMNRDEIRHKLLENPEPVVESGWIREWGERPVSIGVTAGASTPNRVVGEVIERVCSILDLELPHLEPLGEDAPASASAPSREV